LLVGRLHKRQDLCELVEQCLTPAPTHDSRKPTLSRPEGEQEKKRSQKAVDTRDARWQNRD
jgi:hypothetical protein